MKLVTNYANIVKRLKFTSETVVLSENPKEPRLSSVLKWSLFFFYTVRVLQGFPNIFDNYPLGQKQFPLTPLNIFIY